MVEFIAIPATLLGIYALWLVGWDDFLRLVQGVHHTRGQVISHALGSDGFVAVYEFEHQGVMREVRAKVAHASPQPPVGTSSALSYPRRRPDLARPPETFGRIIMYGAAAAWIGFFSDLWLRWS